MSIRWNIQDRSTGDIMVVEHPTVASHVQSKTDFKADKIIHTVHAARVNKDALDNLSSLIGHCSAVGISEQGKGMAKLALKKKAN